MAHTYVTFIPHHPEIDSSSCSLQPTRNIASPRMHTSTVQHPNIPSTPLALSFPIIDINSQSSLNAVFNPSPFNPSVTPINPLAPPPAMSHMVNMDHAPSTTQPPGIGHSTPMLIHNGMHMPIDNSDTSSVSSASSMGSYTSSTSHVAPDAFLRQHHFFHNPNRNPNDSPPPAHRAHSSAAHSTSSSYVPPLRSTGHPTMPGRQESMSNPSVRQDTSHLQHHIFHQFNLPGINISMQCNKKWFENSVLSPLKINIFIKLIKPPTEPRQSSGSVGG